MSYNITIYTDGAARGNPGPGGFGSILIWGNHRKELSKGFRLTTNNRMELLAVIEALEALTKEKCNVTVYTDSRYVADAVEKGWLHNWIKKGFKGKKNPDLWLRFIESYVKHNVRFTWIKGHNENPLNEACDRLAVNASQGPAFFIDTAYEGQGKDQPGIF